MNYGFDCRNWSQEAKDYLAKKLSEEFGYKIGFDFDRSAKKPYIEVDRLMEGVRIRRLTNLPEEEYDRVIKRADEIYLEIKNNQFLADGQYRMRI